MCIYTASNRLKGFLLFVWSFTFTEQKFAPEYDKRKLIFKTCTTADGPERTLDVGKLQREITGEGGYVCCSAK
jgi:hypothetical protein